ncbi:putative 50S ribosomal protein L25 [Corchorus olitorius]|uniref:50S ribosomal protein L25 n=1 Tax=Corchorus olitorius TaxID=93759 RepID=A0A1R3KVI8_9ROSI|nr:putative 50S ribosomal protein L25 [Corchorus olitorius]
MSRWWRGLKTAVQTPTAPSLSARNYHTIQAIPREYTGNRVSARDREQGRIPAMVFNQSLLQKDPVNHYPSRKQLLTTEMKQIKSNLKSLQAPFFCSTTFQLQICVGSGSSVLLDSGRVLPIKANS